jgi:hypothetical protein
MKLSDSKESKLEGVRRGADEEGIVTITEGARSTSVSA